jgi:hypothetical protein
MPQIRFKMAQLSEAGKRAEKRASKTYPAIAAA